jgi:hypothetical protein
MIMSNRRVTKNPHDVWKDCFSKTRHMRIRQIIDNMRRDESFGKQLDMFEETKNNPGPIIIGEDIPITASIWDRSYRKPRFDRK